MQEPEVLKDIVTPHAHDVLSGRGNFVNHHAGNENFRSLVKKHKKEYVACPKAQKPMYSIVIYDEIRSMDPPGRFLKQDPATKLWSDIGKKKALDKTRQALREGAPEMLKKMGGGEDDEEAQPNIGQRQNKKKREDDPLSSSFTSIGSFTVDGMNFPSPDLFSSANQGQGVPGMIVGGHNDMSQSLLNVQLQMVQQQMDQWQQLMNMQQAMNQAGVQLDPATQLQLLQLQLQMQQMQQQQQPPAAFMNTPPNQVPVGTSPQTATIGAAQSSEQNIAALLTALQSAVPQNNVMPNLSAGVAAGHDPLNNFQNQLMMQLNQQFNQANQAASAPANQVGATPSIGQILNAADAINGNPNRTNEEQTAGLTIPMQTDERKPGGTSLVRSQRIGLKNSFTKRPNSHRQGKNPLADSLMSVDAMNLDDVEEMNEEIQEDV